MTDSVVFVVTGDDRPGVVEALAEVVASHEASWVESEITRVAGKVAGILQVEVAKENADAFTRDMEALSSQGLQIRVDQRSGEDPHLNDRQAALEISGPDKPGIVLQISRILARNGIDIDEFHTQRLETTSGGRRSFRADIRVSIPKHVDSREISRAIDLMSDSLHLEATMHELPK